MSNKAKVSDASMSLLKVLTSSMGGTGVDNKGKTITLENNLIVKGVGDLTITTSGPLDLNITDLTEKITTNSSKIASNTSDIATNRANITSNTNAIVENTANITTHSTSKCTSLATGRPGSGSSMHPRTRNSCPPPKVDWISN
jgi:hypothetical protein